jgi:hypothetical protein
MDSNTSIRSGHFEVRSVILRDLITSSTIERRMGAPVMLTGG